MAIKINRKPSKYKQGKTIVTRKEHGYALTEGLVIYRSSYELATIRILSQLYKAKRIESWTYETDVFEYVYDIDGKSHRYYMDFTLIMKSGKKIFIEVKPHSETIPPRRGKNINTYKRASETFIKNTNKWDAVKAFVETENRKAGKEVYGFVIWSEDILGINKKKNIKHTSKYYQRKNSSKKAKKSK